MKIGEIVRELVQVVFLIFNSTSWNGILSESRNPGEFLRQSNSLFWFQLGDGNKRRISFVKFFFSIQMISSDKKVGALNYVGQST